MPASAGRQRSRHHRQAPLHRHIRARAALKHNLVRRAAAEDVGEMHALLELGPARSPRSARGCRPGAGGRAPCAARWRGPRPHGGDGSARRRRSPVGASSAIADELSSLEINSPSAKGAGLPLVRQPVSAHVAVVGALDPGWSPWSAERLSLAGPAEGGPADGVRWRRAAENCAEDVSSKASVECAVGRAGERIASRRGRATAAAIDDDGQCPRAHRRETAGMRVRC